MKLCICYPFHRIQEINQVDTALVGPGNPRDTATVQVQEGDQIRIKVWNRGPSAVSFTLVRANSNQQEDLDRDQPVPLNRGNTPYVKDYPNMQQGTFTLILECSQPSCSQAIGEIEVLSGAMEIGGVTRLLLRNRGRGLC